MNWRRVAEVLRLRRAVGLMDEREAFDRELEKATVELDELAEKTYKQSEAVADMKEQSRLGSYHRVRVR